MKARRLALAGLLGLLALGMSSPRPAAAQTPVPTPAPTPARPPEAAAGLDVYQAHCVGCHGPLGRGDGELAGRLPAPPPSFADPDIVRMQSPATTFDVVTRGRLDKMMPPFQQALDAQERWSAVYGAWSFYYTPERLARGRAAWAERCADCHGIDGRAVASAPLADPAWMAVRSQADLFAATRGAAAHAALGAESDETMWSALDFARSFTFQPLPFAGLAPGGGITGRVINGTPGARGVDGALVRVIPFSERVPGDPVTATIDASGAFTATDLLVGPGIEYRVVASYADADLIYPQAVSLSAQQPVARDVNLTVYEPSADVPLSVRTGHVILSPQPERGVIDVAEVWVLVNSADRTRVADASGVVARWPVLVGAQELRFGDPRMRSVSRVDGDVVLDRVATPPGEREVVLRYEVPYSGSTLDLTRTLPLPLGELRLLVAGSQATIESTALTEQQTTTVEGHDVVSAMGRNLSAGTPIEARIGGLPPPRQSAAQAILPLPPPRLDQRTLALVGLVLAGSGILMALSFPALAARRRGDGAWGLVGERARLVDELAALDHRHEEGAIAAEAYRARRAALLGQAIAVARAQSALEEHE